MDALLGLLGVAGLGVAIIMLIVKAVFKKGWQYKNIGILAGVAMVLLVIGLSVSPSTSPTAEKGLDADPDAAQQTSQQVEQQAEQQDGDVSEGEGKSDADMEKKLALDDDVKNQDGFGDSSTDEIKSEPKPDETETQVDPATVEEKPKTYKEWLKSVIEKETGARSNLDTPRIAEIKFDDDIESKPILLLIANDNITLNLVRVGMLSDATKIFQNIFADGRADSVMIFWGRPVTDDYGNTTLKPVMAIQMTKETAGKINWDNFLYDKLPTVADDYHEEPKSNW